MCKKKSQLSLGSHDLIIWRRERDYFMIPDEAASDHQIMRLRCAASFSFFINSLIKPAACCGISSKLKISTSVGSNFWAEREGLFHDPG
jgi:hypothetical protein